MGTPRVLQALRRSDSGPRRSKAARKAERAAAKRHALAAGKEERRRAAAASAGGVGAGGPAAGKARAAGLDLPAWKAGGEGTSRRLGILSAVCCPTYPVSTVHASLDAEKMCQKFTFSFRFTGGL